MARISAIVLAAGKSERMGRPKALLPFRGATFLENILTVIAASDVRETVVVLGRHRDEIQGALKLPNAVFNPDYEQGMITSMQTGIRAISGGSEGALLLLVDHPSITTPTINVLIERFAPDRIVVPKYGGRRGHPVLFARTVLDEILDLSPALGANGVVWKDPARVVEVGVDDPGVTFDIDTPEDYSRLCESSSGKIK